MVTRTQAMAISGLYGESIKQLNADMFGKVSESLGMRWRN